MFSATFSTGRKIGRDRIKDEIHGKLKKLIAEGQISNRDEVIKAMKNLGLTINHAGKDYVSVKMPESGMKLRFRGGIYAATDTSIDESE